MAKKGKVGRKAKSKGPKIVKTNSAAVAVGAVTPLKRICAEFGIDAKRARVKLRRAWRKEGETNVTFHAKGGRWDLSPKQATEVRSILRPSA